ncbi:Psp-related protein [Histomonas meleagridis]|uniref:Psp-related protein n=1 Tax=Histomonas meleagridis TaxID=135588 RepID=UPI003559E476|nr:Psp-related protein [Histomonas meleagridis]KAH0803258.1 Psp-related protein [Histomonas meleagridis]
MTEEQKKQFAKKQPAKCRTTDFFWRGGDPLREQEYLIEEYKKALAEFRQSEAQLKAAKKDVNDAQDVLNEREGYAIALASYLEQDTTYSRKERELRAELSDLESEIEKKDRELRVIKSIHNPATSSALVKENATYMIEIQRGNQTIENYRSQQDEYKRQMAACTVNNRYRHALELEYERDRTQNKKIHLHKIVNSTKNEFEEQKIIKILQDPDSRIERNALQRLVPLEVEIALLEEKLNLHPTKHDNYLSLLIDQIEELNSRMEEIGLGDEVVATGKIKEKVFGGTTDSDESSEYAKSDTENKTNSSGEERKDSSKSDKSHSDSDKSKSQNESHSENNKTESHSDNNKSYSQTDKRRNESHSEFSKNKSNSDNDTHSNYSNNKSHSDSAKSESLNDKHQTESHSEFSKNKSDSSSEKSESSNDKHQKDSHSDYSNNKSHSDKSDFQNGKQKENFSDDFDE